MNTATPFRNPMAGPPSAAADAPFANRLDVLGALGLLLAMVPTRASQSSPQALPDASIAVFFLLGLVNRSALWLPLAMVLAAAVDACVVTGDVSAYCTTPAALFLIPTYATMWLAGRMARRRRPIPPFSSLVARRDGPLRDGVALRDGAALLATAGLAAAVAFLISSGSFYFLSGQFPALRLADYSRLVLIRYLPPYVAHCLLYVAAGLALSHAALWRRLAGRIRRREPAA